MRTRANQILFTISLGATCLSSAAASGLSPGRVLEVWQTNRQIIGQVDGRVVFKCPSPGAYIQEGNLTILSPDNRFIALPYRSRPVQGLYCIECYTRSTRHLAAQPEVVEAHISPDSRFVSVFMQIGGAPSSHEKLVVFDLITGARNDVATDVYGVAWGRAGSTLYYVDVAGGVGCYHALTRKTVIPSVVQINNSVGPAYLGALRFLQSHRDLMNQYGIEVSPNGRWAWIGKVAGGDVPFIHHEDPALDTPGYHLPEAFGIVDIQGRCKSFQVPKGYEGTYLTPLSWTSSGALLLNVGSWNLVVILDPMTFAFELRKMSPPEKGASLIAMASYRPRASLRTPSSRLAVPREKDQRKDGGKLRPPHEASPIAY